MTDQTFDAVIVTGSRNWTDKATIWNALEAHLAVGGYLIHGACQGADRIAETFGQTHDCEMESFPYPSFMGKAGGPVRNQQMLSRLIDLTFEHDATIGVLAFHDDPSVETAKKGGTADVIRKARARGVPVLLFRSSAFVQASMLAGMEAV